jgi:hypothetical protein
MPSERFRRQLRQEAQQWYAEGTIDAALYGELARRYRFEALEEASRNRFAALLFGLGGLTRWACRYYLCRRELAGYAQSPQDGAAVGRHDRR